MNRLQSRRAVAIISILGQQKVKGAEATPHVRDWCKRVLRCLATIMTYTPPVNLPPTVAALGMLVKQAHSADGGGAAAAAAVADDDSSDASSAYHPEEAQQDAQLPPSLAAAVAAATATQGQALGPAQSVETAAFGGHGTAANGDTAAPGGQAPEEAAKQRAAPGNSYLVHSAAASVPVWGYPFAPLSAIALQNSKRARRHRALSQHLIAAAAAAEAPRPVVAAGLCALQPPEEDATAPCASPASGPTLSSRTQYRLDNETFWTTVQTTHSPWQELTGPSDPVLLRGCFVWPDPARGNASTITVMLSAVNRLPVDISDVEVALKTNGPLLSSSRRAAAWELPRMAAHDRAVASFTFKLLGYGDLQLHPRLQLCPGPARTDSSPLQLICLPLDIPSVVLLRPPRLLPEPADFFKTWGTLPARAELSGACTWPGPEGGALLLSALLRQPLGCVWLQHVPAVYGFQAAFVADTAPGDVLSLVVVTQLMPAPAPGGTAETFFTFSLRSSSPDLVLCIQNGAASWLTQVSSGTASLGGAGRTGQPAPSAKPTLHPRVSALLQSYAASAAQLDTLAPMGSFGLAGVDAAPPGPDGLNTVMLKNAALLEWQRLSSLAM